MEVKEEYIEFLRMYRDALVQEGKLSNKSLSYEKLGTIISLLQQGEAYRKLLVSVETMLIPGYFRNYNMKVLEVFKKMYKEDKQKYLKEAKQDEADNTRKTDNQKK